MFFSFFMRTVAVFSVSWLYRMCPVRSLVKHTVATSEDSASPQQSEKMSYQLSSACVRAGKLEPQMEAGQINI